MFHKGRKKFGHDADKAALKELDQLHKCSCFTQIGLSALTPEERKKAQAALMLITEKHDGTIKGHCVYEGSKTRPYFSK